MPKLKKQPMSRANFVRVDSSPVNACPQCGCAINECECEDRGSSILDVPLVVTLVLTEDTQVDDNMVIDVTSFFGVGQITLGTMSIEPHESDKINKIAETWHRAGHRVRLEPRGRTVIILTNHSFKWQNYWRYDVDGVWEWKRQCNTKTGRFKGKAPVVTETPTHRDDLKSQIAEIGRLADAMTQNVLLMTEIIHELRPHLHSGGKGGDNE